MWYYNDPRRNARIRQVQLGDGNRLEENIDAVISYLKKELLQ